MDVYEAVTSRRAVRGFTDEPVSRVVLERVLSAAAWSPSGSNLQPWNSYVLTGALLAALKTRAVERVAHGDPWDELVGNNEPGVDLSLCNGKNRLRNGHGTASESPVKGAGRVGGRGVVGGAECD